jgi:catechol 2,3-dioxygenase-like lactoylglutathione lyase family enzyme
MRLLTASVILLLGVPASWAQQPSAAALDHVALYVADLDRSVSFYKRLFGSTEVKAPFPIARWLVLRNGLMLHIVSGRTQPLENTKWDHFALACPDMDQMIAVLAANAVPWTDMEGNHAPQVRPDGVKQIFVRDPDGYWIEINDMLKGR